MENDDSFFFRCLLKVLIFPEVGRIFWNFFPELIDAMEFCRFLKIIQVGWRNI